MNFLSDAAHLLFQTAPQTSAFLMSRRNELLVENDIPISDAQRQHVCSSCGHIMIPGGQQKQQDTLKIETGKALRSKGKRRLLSSRAQQTSSTPAAPPSDSRAMPAGISKILTCGSCSRKTKIKLDGPKRISRTRKAAQQSKVSDERKLQTAAEPVKSSANASSKKRAKNRKAGLQALLDQKKGSGSSSSGFGLSLSDFMRK